jgi:hypothetical protein
LLLLSQSRAPALPYSYAPPLPTPNSQLPTPNMSDTETVTAAELEEIIVELQKYRDRLVHDTTEAIHKAKLPKSKAMAQMEPELAKIDAMMQELHDRHAALLANN